MTPRAKRPKTIVIADYLRERAEFRSYNQTTPCDRRPDLFVDYGTTPTVDEADAMCKPCPFYKGENICLEYAEVTKPKVGVWGGVAWNKDGRPQTVRSVANAASKKAA